MESQPSATQAATSVNPTPTIPIPPSQPIQTLYQSARILPQLPNNPPASGSTSQPFLGFSSLAPPIATQQANQARLSSSVTTIPRQQQLPRRGVRHHPSSRTQRSATPTLGRRSGKAKIEDCLVLAEGSQTLVRIQVRVYPPVVCVTIIINFPSSQFR